MNTYRVVERPMASGAVEFETRNASGEIISTVVLSGHAASLIQQARREGMKSNG